MELPDKFLYTERSYDSELKHYFTPEGRQYFPLTFQKHVSMLKPGEKQKKYTFPYEPIINITQKKNFTQRYVAKGKHNGSIKEFWSNGDYEITIVGTIEGMEDFNRPTVENNFPVKDMEILRDFLTESPLIQVFNEQLQILDIHEIIITGIEFPFVKGENVLGYVIKALSNHPAITLYKEVLKPIKSSDKMPDNFRNMA